MLVAGESGAGKTSLVRGFVESVDDSVLVLFGACDPPPCRPRTTTVEETAHGGDAELDQADIVAATLAARIPRGCNPDVAVKDCYRISVDLGGPVR